MKTNIKMRVTLEQSIKVQEICFENGIIWTHKAKQLTNLHLPYLYICKIEGIYATSDIECYDSHLEYQEIDADLFIRTNGTCEEVFKEQETYKDGDFINCIDSSSSSTKYKVKVFELLPKSYIDYNTPILKAKLKKKNEILKKARIKRKNQREELHKLNLKLQKCISLGEHNIATQKLRDTIVSLRDDVINKVDNITYNKNKEIEKLKAVIEYLESKVK